MNPELVHVLERYAGFAKAVAGEPEAALKAHDELAGDLALEASSRSEALRSVLMRLGGAIGAMMSAESLRALAPSGGSEPEVVSSLEAALGSLVQLAIGARARLDPEGAPVAPPPASLRPLTVAVSRVLSGADDALGAQVLAAALDEVLSGVPKAIGKLVTSVVWQLTDLPKESRDSSSAPSLRVVEALPTWLPPRRTIGGFYVVRALSAGAVGSVFVATRVEDKGETTAERFALKVPEYSASVARSLSEVEFLTMFRDEASALIALPQHPNLARFVTFDAGSKPKPILVMELVEGTTLEHVLEARGVDTSRVLQILDDVLRGLEAMHAAGVGHLDLKPSNVVLRRDEQAVLVDFGLAGRHIRPGCATGAYGAPEVWGALEGRKDLTPMKADVYAFGCVAFEALTSRVLFQADSEMAQIAKHVGHDGFPPPLRELTKRTELGPLTELLYSTLRQDPVSPADGRHRAQGARARRPHAGEDELAAERLGPSHDELAAERPGPHEMAMDAPDPDGRDCVACGRCCHHGPNTVHLLEPDEERVLRSPDGAEVLRRLTVLDDRPPGWRFVKNTGEHCGALDVSVEVASRASLRRPPGRLPDRRARFAPAASRRGGSGTSGRASSSSGLAEAANGLERRVHWRRAESYRSPQKRKERTRRNGRPATTGTLAAQGAWRGGICQCNRAHPSFWPS